MMHPVGLHKFEARFPERTFDVGIAEQHAATSAAGLAIGGLHPVVAVYATFLNRAFDQVLMDVALHRCGVTFVLDRSGVTGDDGASHNGMWDMSVLQVVPGLRLAAPRDATRMRELLDEAVEVDDAPTVVRFPKGPPPDDVPAIGQAGGADVLVRKGRRDVLVVAVGSMASVAVEVADRLVAQGIGVTVVDPRWVKPVDPAIVDLARDHRLVVSIEDNGRVGGCGAVLLQTLNDAGVTTPFRLHGIPQEFLGHAKRAVILERIGLTAQALARGIVEDVAALPEATPARARDGSPWSMSTSRADQRPSFVVRRSAGSPPARRRCRLPCRRCRGAGAGPDRLRGRPGRAADARASRTGDSRRRRTGPQRPRAGRHRRRGAPGPAARAPRTLRLRAEALARA